MGFKMMTELFDMRGLDTRVLFGNTVPTLRV
jgi:hypothetical protein